MCFAKLKIVFENSIKRIEVKLFPISRVEPSLDSVYDLLVLIFVVISII